MNGVKGEGNDADALEFYEEAAVRGDVHSQVQLGKMYLHGAGIDRDYKLALAWYRKAAQQGDGEALAELGFMHEKGLGVDPHLQKALDCYKKAIARGSALGQIRLADLYLNGLGIEQSTRKALACYQKSAEQDKDPQSAGLALLRWGALYFQGRGVEKDLRKGFELYLQAAKLGNAEAQRCVGAMYRDGVGVGRDHNKALGWFKKSARGKSAPADSAMGDIYRDGLFVEKNIPEAMKWYGKAAGKGDKYARIELLKLQQEEGAPPRDAAASPPAAPGDSPALAEAARTVRAGAGSDKRGKKAKKKWSLSVRGKLQQARRSIGARLMAVGKTAEKPSRPAAPSAKKPARRAPAPRTLRTVSSAIGVVAIALMILLLDRVRESRAAPEGPPPLVVKTVVPSPPERPAVPADLFLSSLEAPAKTNAGAPRQAKNKKPLPIPEADPVAAKAEPAAPLFRREYKSLDPEEIARLLTARNLFDAVRNPAGGCSHQYEPMSVAGLTLIVDRATDLVWTRQQIPVKMNLEKTLSWIESLNRIQYGGGRRWRLPTVEEAASLLEKNPETKVFLHGIFGEGLQVIWTGDRSAESDSWVVDFQGGTVKSVKNKSRLMTLMVSSDSDSPVN